QRKALLSCFISRQSETRSQSAAALGEQIGRRMMKTRCAFPTVLGLVATAGSSHASGSNFTTRTAAIRVLRTKQDKSCSPLPGCTTQHVPRLTCGGDRTCAQ